MTGLEVVELGPLGEGSVREKGQLGQGWNLACSSLRSMLRSPPRACGRLALHGGQGRGRGPCRGEHALCLVGGLVERGSPWTESRACGSRCSREGRCNGGYL